MAPVARYQDLIARISGVVRFYVRNHRCRRRLLRCQQLDSRFASDIGLAFTDLLVEEGASFLTPVGLLATRRPPPAEVAGTQ